MLKELLILKKTPHFGPRNREDARAWRPYHEKHANLRNYQVGIHGMLPH